MKMQDLFVVTLAILLAAGVSLSQSSAGPAAPAPPSQSVSAPSSNSSQGEVRTTIVAVKYYPANELGSLLRTLSEGQVQATTDEHTRRLILTGPAKRIEQMLRLIEELDVPNMEGQETQYLTYRAYMLELPARNQNLKPFSVLLERPSQSASGHVLEVAKAANVQVGTLLQDNQWMGDDKWGLVIEGRTPSEEALQQMLATIPDSTVKELRWEDQDFTSTLSAAQVSRLPGPLQDHIRKFLGDQVQTMGYGFGNLSVPGEIKAPVGPWSMEMKAQSEQGDSLTLEIRVARESHIPFVPDTQLLSNTVQIRAGRPILIGYNRDAYGARVMGAMVILLESDAPAAPEAKPSEPERR
ncbi:MAG: hypothetical protein JW955_05970 [Sedimentisphaerales bacterium]|nr:hypothetical protein [Sedimentisphaerales bacterium]